jgi:hypothetical protein
MRRAGAARFVLRGRSLLPTLIVGGAQLPRISARHKFFGGVDGALGVVALLIRDQLGVRVKHLRTISLRCLRDQAALHGCTVDEMFLPAAAIDAESCHSSLHSARVARNVVFGLLVASDVRERPRSFW